MPRIWCSISGHGFGHGAQTIIILNELNRRIPELHVLFRTDLPHQFLKENLTMPWELFPSSQDIGCVQDGPLLIDEAQTWIAYERFQNGWSQKVQAETELIRSHQPDLILSNISYFGIEAGAKTGIPTIGLGSVSWDQVLEYLSTQASGRQRRIIDQIRRSYRMASLMIRFAPIIPMVAFAELVDVGPIVGPPLKSTGVVRDLLKMKPGEKLVLVAFGGIRLASLPLAKLEGFKGYRFLVYGSMEIGKHSHVSSLTDLAVPFRDIMAETDLIITKPGYATVIEAVRNAIPVVYVRRYNFVDEQNLVDYAHRFGQARELSIQEFIRGEWLEALEKVQQIPLPNENPPAPGTSAAAETLAKYF